MIWTEPEDLLKDFQILSDDKSIPWEQLNNKNILVTGATGLVGSILVKSLLYENEINNRNFRVYAFVRNKNKANKIFEEQLNSNLCLFEGDICSPINIYDSIDYIIHAASVTESKVFVSQPVETLNTTIYGTKNLLEFAKKKSVTSMVYISSMEIYGITDPKLSDVKENDYGYIDPLKARSSYSEGKRIAECLCSAYAHEYKVPVKMTRLAQTFGAGVSKEENRVFAQFAKSIINKQDIVLHTKGESYGNYSYTRDTIAGILIALLKGENGEAYNVCNPNNTMMIKEMAQLVVETFPEAGINLRYDIPASNVNFGYAPDVKMKLNSEKLQALGWKPNVEMKEMYIRMIRSM